MNRFLSCSTAIALAMVAGNAMADVTPEEVWDGWQELATSAGQELTFDSAVRNGDTLEVSGLKITYSDDQGASLAADFGTMKFTDMGDGTVDMTMTESYPIAVTLPAEGEGPKSFKATVTQPGLVVTAGGSATETNYEFSAPMVTVTLDELIDSDGQPNETKADLVMTDTVAKYVVLTEGDVTKLDSSFTAKSLAVNVAGKGADDTGEGVVTVSVADVAGTTKGNLLGAEIMANMATALNAGFTTDSSFSFGAMAINADITDSTGPTKLVGSMSGGSFDLSIDKDKITYGTSSTGGSFTLSGPEIPFPQVTTGFAEVAFGILMPVSKSDVPQDFTFLTKLVDFTISEDVWGLVDPGVTLPRDPATVIFDIKGTGFWKQDIMDPAVQMEGVEPPGELTSVDLTQILVKAVGTEVGATGGLTFDNTDLETFDGVPAPTGTINVSIKGANALIDNLIAMGIVPEDQALGARMMLGLFARPGAGPDELTSVIEFKDGGLFANGQQLQ